MPDDPATDSFIQKANEADTAYNSGEYRRAAALYDDASTVCAQLLGQENPPIQKTFLIAGRPYFQAAASQALYRAATAEGEPDTTREDHADSMIRAARQAIACLRGMSARPKFFDEAYGMLLNGYEYLMRSRQYLDGMMEAGKQMEAAIDEYRKLISPQEFEHLFKRLLVVRATTNMTEGVKMLTSDRNPQASRQCFKRAQEFADQVIKATDNHQEKEQFKRFIELLGGMSSLGEALALQEKGDYLEAEARMKEAEAGFAVEPTPEALAISQWAKAMQPYLHAMNDELEGGYNAAVTGYEQAAKALAVAADAFPATSSPYASLGSWVRFYAESAAARAKTTQTRKGWERGNLEKTKRQAGLLFFGLWLAGIATEVAAIRILMLSVNALSFLALVLVSFLAAGVAAALIKPEAATDLLGSIFSQMTGIAGGVRKSKK